MGKLADSPASRQAHHRTGVSATLLFFAASAPVVLGSWSAHAQVVTSIAPTTGAGSTATSISSVAGEHEIGGGAIRGGNLFHSFDSFDLASGETARWINSAGGADAIRNLINRISGGDVSEIYGRLDATAFANADFYLINPSGIVFGQGASVAVPNGFHVSTADELQFSDGFMLAMTGPTGSVLTSAAPQSYGFVGPSARLALEGATLNEFSEAAAVSLVGGALDITDESRVDVRSGKVLIAAVASGASFDYLSTDPSLEGVTGGDLHIRDGAKVFADAYDGSGAEAVLSLIGGDLVFSGASQTTSDNVGSTIGGRVLVRATGDVIIDGGSVLRASAFGSGDAIGVDLQIDGSLLIDGADATRVTGIASSSQTDLGVAIGGNAGSITLEASSVTLANGGQIQSISNFRGGDSGAIHITAGDVEVRGGGNTNLTTISNSLEDGSLGASKSLVIVAENLRVTNGGQIQSVTFSTGDAGAIMLDVSGDIVLDGEDEMGATGIFTQAETGSRGSGGRIEVSGSNLEIRNGAEIAANSRSTGGSGVIQIHLSGNATLVGADGRSTGVFAQTSANAEGELGQILLSAEGITLADGAAISALTESTRASDAGSSATSSIQILAATSLSIVNAGLVSSETRGTRDGGAINIVAPETNMARSRITAATSGAGAAGAIVMSGDKLVMDDVSSMTTSTTGEGVAGTVQIGSAGARYDLVDLQNGSTIATSSAGMRAAGDVEIQTNRMTIFGDGSALASEATGTDGAAAGSIHIGADDVRLLEGGAITTDSLTGAAGDINLALANDGLLVIRGAALPATITTSSGPGTGGRITVARPNVLLSDNGRILALGEAAGANVSLEAGYFIRSADAENLLLVDGVRRVDADVEDVSRGAQEAEPEFVDPSQILEGRCLAVRSTGQSSKLALSRIGPYALTSQTDGTATGSGRAVANAGAPEC